MGVLSLRSQEKKGVVNVNRSLALSTPHPLSIGPTACPSSRLNVIKAHPQLACVSQERQQQQLSNTVELH